MIRASAAGCGVVVPTVALPADVPINGVACRGARAMLGVSQVDLSESAQCGRSLLNDFENGVRVPRGRNVAKIREALEMMGAVFLYSGGEIAVKVAHDLAAVRTPRARTLASD